MGDTDISCCPRPSSEKNGGMRQLALEIAIGEEQESGTNQVFPEISNPEC